MAREIIDGYESGGLELVGLQSGAAVVSAVTGMSGNYCLDLTDGADYAMYYLTSANTYYFKFRYRPTNDGASSSILTVFIGTTAQVRLLRNTTSKAIDIYRGLSTVLANGIIPLAVNTTYLIECYIYIANAGGRITIKIDSITDDDIDFTGDTQAHASSDQMDRVYFGRPAGSVTDGAFYMDDLVINSAGWVGNSRIQAVVPTGAGTTTQWTPSAGSNWQTVDELPASDADYNSINANDQTDTFATGNLTGSIDNVKCVQVQVRAWKEGAVTPQNIKLAVRSGGTDYLSGNKAVPDTNPTGLYNIWETDPNTAAAWTEGGVNAMEAGYKSAA